MLWVDVGVLLPSTSSLSVTVCAPATYDFNGQILGSTGTYTSTLMNAVFDGVAVEVAVFVGVDVNVGVLLGVVVGVSVLVGVTVGVAEFV